MLIHVVKPGDTLWQLAVYYGVPIARMLDVNKLPNPNVLLVGQSLLIPTGTTYHTVKIGESLWKIAQTYGTTVQSIAKANGIVNTASIYPGAVLVIPRGQKPVIEVNGYTYTMGEKAVPIVRDVGKDLTYLSPFAYRIMEDGGLEPIDDSPAIREAYAKRAVPMMSITNFTSTELGQNLAHIVLSTPSVRERTITNIINVMKQKGYRGINIDFEGVLPSDRENYNVFLQRTVDRLHPEGFFVSTALAPKTGGEQKGTLYEAHDYPAHGRIADFVVLMTYEWGYRKGPPQAISPLDQIKRVLDYAVSVIPRNKIFFGFQLYARDWLIPHVQGQEAATFSVQEAVRRAVRYNATIQYNKKAESPFFRYKDGQGRMHEVWFEDARSAKAKFDTVKSYRLKGISYWVLGLQFPQNWALLEDNFSIKKLI